MFLVSGTATALLPVSFASAADPAVALIERFYASLRAAMARASSDSVAEKARLLSGPVNSTFDTAAMTRLATGQMWSRIPGGQQGAIQQAFGRFLVATYAKQIRGYSGERFEVSPATEKRRIGTLVRSKIIEGNGSSTNIDYIVSSGGRVIDIYLNSSVSELASRHAEFESILTSGGANALLNSLNDRTNRLLAS
jgi:phospholipid transport system substrate-binding protein